MMTAGLPVGAGLKKIVGSSLWSWSTVESERSQHASLRARPHADEPGSTRLFPYPRLPFWLRRKCLAKASTAPP